MKNRFFFIFVFILLALPIVVAQEERTFQFNTHYDLKRPCFNNGTFCTVNSLCNLTLEYPGGDLIFNNIRMSRNGSFFNATVGQNINNQLGIHPAIMSCCDGAICGPDTFNVVITADGKPFQEFPTQIVFIIFSFILIAFGLFDEKFKIFKSTGGILLMIMGVITLYPGYSFINYSTLMGKAIGAISIGLGFYFLVEDSFSRESQENTFEQIPRKGVMD